MFTIVIVGLIGAAFFAGTALGYRTGVVDGRWLSRYQRHQAWVEDLEGALAETKPPSRTAPGATRAPRPD